MNRLAGLTAFAVLAFAFNVSAQDTAEPHAYFPLKVGSEWTYKVQGGPIKVKVAGTEKVATGTGYKLETTAGNKVSATEVVGITKDGVQRFNVNGLNPDAPILFLPKDVEGTKEWNVDTKVAGQEIKGTFKVNKEKVTVPFGAGTFDAIHVKGTDMAIGATKTTVEYWFVKDIGIVKLKFTLGSQDATLELENYAAGK